MKPTKPNVKDEVSGKMRTNVYCYFCSNFINLQLDEFYRTVDILREGPYVSPTRYCCKKCYESKNHLSRSQCQFCGKLRSLLRTDNDSISTKWRSLGTGKQEVTVTVCPECSESPDFKETISTLKEPLYTAKIPLTNDEILLLKKCWKIPGWERMTKMPYLIREIDE